MWEMSCLVRINSVQEWIRETRSGYKFEDPFRKKKLPKYIIIANFTKLYGQVGTLLGLLAMSLKKHGQMGRAEA